MNSPSLPVSEMPPAETAVRALLADGLLSRAGYPSLARLLPHVVERRARAGETLFSRGDSADHLYLVLEGEVGRRTADGQVRVAIARCGEEAATDCAAYLADAVALSDVRLLSIPRSSLANLLAGNPGLRSDFYLALTSLLAGAEQGTVPAAKAAPPAERGGAKAVVGWLVALLAPAAILFLGGDWGLERNALYFVAVFSSAIVMWIFSLVDEYLPGIFALLATLAMGLVPVPVILAGLASDGFVLAMSILGLAAVIVSSGLSYRLLLLLLYRLPNTPFWQNFGLLLTGFALTPLVPSINGRVALLTPFMQDMGEILRLAPKGQAATRLAVSAFTGASLLSAVFLSSKSVNFVVFGLLPDQAKDQFQWLDWLLAAGGTGIALLAGYFLLAAVMFPGGGASGLSKDQVAAQLSVLGPVKRREWAALLGIGAFMVGIATAGLHKVQPPWLSLAVLYALLLFGTLTKKEFQEKIDWPFLMYLAGIVGITAAFGYLGIDRMIAARLPELGEYMRTNFPAFIAILFAVVFVIRLAVPISATIVILATIFMPLAETYGANPWVVGFVILVVGEMWFFPYQCSYYLQFRQLTHHCESFDERRFLVFNALGNAAKLAAVYLSIPWWKAMGLL
ncbi:MAG: SLC13 family permease [Actinomycetota bacterium]